MPIHAVGVMCDIIWNTTLQSVLLLLYAFYSNSTLLTVAVH